MVGHEVTGHIAPDTLRVPVAPGVSLQVRRWRPAVTSGPPFLLVHGLASNGRLWDGVADVLAALGHEVVAVDQRGHGLSDKPEAGYDFATVTRDLVALIGELGLDRPVAVGQSWGGNVVVELAARAPEAIRGVAAIDGGTIDLAAQFPTWEEASERLRPPALAGTPAADLEARIRANHPDWPETGIRGMMGNFEIRGDGTVAPWLTLPRHMAILRALWEHHPHERMASIGVPVLVVPAETADAAWTAAKRASTARAEALLPRSRVVWMTGDHDLHAQHPAEIAALLHGATEDGFFA